MEVLALLPDQYGPGARQRSSMEFWNVGLTPTAVLANDWYAWYAVIILISGRWSARGL
ncbi:MAG: hypothetical protein M3Y84_05490 [Acidobacteriota bacterium]|nr:hypothetical protein [Acidobacteriota bacterium]